MQRDASLANRRKKRIERLTAQNSPPQRTPADVVAATFANLDLRACKAALETYYTKFTQLEMENKMLREDLAQHAEDSLHVVQRLEEKLKESMEESVKYKDEIHRIMADNSDSNNSLMHRYNEMLKERDRQILDYSAVTERLQQDLRNAAHFVQQRQEHDMELKLLHDQLEEVTAKHERDIAALRFQTLDRKMKLVSLEKTMRQGFKEIVAEEANRLLKSQHHMLLERNHALEVEKVDMAHDIEDLMNLANTFTTDRDAMRRRAELHREAHKQVLRQTAQSNLRSREQEEKVQELEGTVRELLVKIKTTKEETSRQYSDRIVELETELRDTENSLKIHREELLQMKELVRKVVNERSDLERFFYVALQDCQRYRKQMDSSLSCSTPIHFSNREKENTVINKSSVIPSHLKTFGKTSSPKGENKSPLEEVYDSSLPPVKTHSSRTSNGKNSVFMTEGEEQPKHLFPPESGAYIETLPWEDKEKIIKALLYYINTTYYKSDV